MNKRSIMALIFMVMVICTGCGNQKVDTISKQEQKMTETTKEEKQTEKGRDGVSEAPKEEQVETKEKELVPSNTNVDKIISETLMWGAFHTQEFDAMEYERLSANQAIPICVLSILGHSANTLEVAADGRGIITKESLESTEKVMFGQVFDISTCTMLEDYPFELAQDGSILCAGAEIDFSTARYMIKDVQKGEAEDTYVVTVYYYTMDENMEYGDQDFVANFTLRETMEGQYQYDIVDFSGKTTAHNELSYNDRLLYTVSQDEEFYVDTTIELENIDQSSYIRVNFNESFGMPHTMYLIDSNGKKYEPIQRAIGNTAWGTSEYMIFKIEPQKVEEEYTWLRFCSDWKGITYPMAYDQGTEWQENSTLPEGWMTYADYISKYNKE